MKREQVILGGLVLLLVCGITNASKKWRKSSRSSEEEEPPDFGAIEKEAYMKQLQYEFEMREQNPFLCLPKYLCIVQSQTGQKKTAVLSSLRPIPYDILEQQENSGGPFPFPVLPNRKPSSDSEESKEKDKSEESQEEEDADDLRDGNGSDSREFGLERDDVLSALAMENAENKNNNVTERPGVMGKLKSFLKPSFKLPSMPSLSMPKMPSLSLFKGSDNKNKAQIVSTNLLKRMQQRRKSFLTRVKRQAVQIEDSEEGVENQERPDDGNRNNTGPRTPEQCQLLFKGCELTYEEIMKIAANGQVVVEKDAPRPPPPFTSPNDPGYARPPQRKRPIRIEDDELDAFLREQAQKKIADLKKATPRPNSIKYYSNYHPTRPHLNIPNGLLVHELRPAEAAQLLYPKGIKQRPAPIKLQQFQHAQEFLTQDSKYGSSSSFYNIHKPLKPVKPVFDEDDDSGKIPSVGLPILPVRFQWGRPVQIGNKYVKPLHQKKQPAFHQAAPAPYYTSTTEPPPIFSKTPVDKKVSQNIPIFANRTHQAILQAKPYHPFHIPRVKQFDKFGRPVSYASVFTEVAGSSGGVHDFFDKIASTIGENVIKTEQDLQNSNKRRVSRRKKNRVTQTSTTAKPIDSEEDKDTATKEEDDPEDSEEKENQNTNDKDVDDEKDKDADNEKDKDEEEEEEDEENDEDADENANEDDEEDDTGLQDNHNKKKNKYHEEKEILANLPPFMQETIKNDRIRRKNKKKKKKNSNSNDEEEKSKSDRRRGEPSHHIEYSPIPLRRPMNPQPQRSGFFSSIYKMMSPKRNGWMSG